VYNNSLLVDMAFSCVWGYTFLNLKNCQYSVPCTWWVVMSYGVYALACRTVSVSSEVSNKLIMLNML
jgi:hypothetical protein